MNIDSIQSANPPQRTATPDAAQQASRQARASTALPEQQRNIQTDTKQNRDTDQNQLSVQDAVKRLEDFVSIARADISFSIDGASGVHVVKIVDKQSQQVIRQFPSEEAIRIAQALDKLQGIFVQDRV